MFQSFSYNTFYDGVSVVSVQTKSWDLFISRYCIWPMFFL